ncbi:MAG: hypothetical protein GY938_12090 [Ketobacter sp.]|nr:hypothetical protein [Ketobacter sp.]
MFSQFLLLALAQVSNKNSQQRFFLGLVAEWKGLTNSGRDFLRSSTGSSLSGKTYRNLKKQLQETCVEETTKLFAQTPSVVWIDNYNPSRYWSKSQLGSRPTGVFSWTVVGFHPLPLDSADLRLLPYSGCRVTNGLPSRFPTRCVEELCGRLKNFTQLTFFTSFAARHQVYNFPAQLSKRHTPTVSSEQVARFKKAGKLDDFHNFEFLRHNTASNVGLFRDLLWLQNTLQNARPDTYQLLVVDENIYKRVVKVCLALLFFVWCFFVVFLSFF